VRRFFPFNIQIKNETVAKLLMIIHMDGRIERIIMNKDVDIFNGIKKKKLKVYNLVLMQGGKDALTSEEKKFVK